MKADIIKTLSLLFLAVALNACSAGGTTADTTSASQPEAADAVPNLQAPETPKSFATRAQEWADFVGTRPLEDERLQTFTELNASGCCTSAAGLKIYLGRLLAEDATFATSVDQLKLANRELLHSFQCLSTGTDAARPCESSPTMSFSEFHAAALVDNYGRMVEQADFARQRIVTTAAILGWTVHPAPILPSSLSDSFIDPVNRAILKAAADDSEAFPGGLVPSIDAKLLQAVTFGFDDGIPQSFFQFAISDPFAGSGRGIFELSPTEFNALFFTVHFTVTP